MSDDHVTLPDDEPDQPTEVQPRPEPDVADQAATAPEPVVPVCGDCGALLDEDQPYCLECGAPTPAASTLRRRLGPTAILALGLAALGIGAGTLAYAIANEDEQTATVPTAITAPPTDLPTFPTTPTAPTISTALPPFPSTVTPPVTIPPTVSIDPTTTIPPTTGGTTTIPPTVSTAPPTVSTSPTTTTPPRTTTTTPRTTTTSPPSTGADTWPNGTSGWTVIVASTSSQSDATALRNRLRSSGRSAGLLDTSQYSTLEPDLWAVYIGVHSSRSQALSQAAALRKSFPGAYAQRIVEG